METSSLWQRSFGGNGKDPSVQRLVVSLRDVRRRAALLTSRIASALPGLTLHDVSHLDALWDVADVIAGVEFVLNPLEAYVFGCAVLLHDAGLCFEAFAGGRTAVRETVQWRDARQRLASWAECPEREADFEALRSLHAMEAERLATRAWHAEDGSATYIIDDSELREHYGRLIGQVAASHHWDIEDVAREFAEPRPPAPMVAANWSVDALKVACLLRAADAGHIDGRRAPTFLLKILQMNSLSRDHWEAQNHLGRLMVSPQDPTLLVVSSTAPFTRPEAHAWWVAFDAMVLLDKEIRDCNDLLTSAPRFSPGQLREDSSGGRRKGSRDGEVRPDGRMGTHRLHCACVRRRRARFESWRREPVRQRRRSAGNRVARAGAERGRRDHGEAGAGRVVRSWPTHGALDQTAERAVHPAGRRRRYRHVADHDDQRHAGLRQELLGQRTCRAGVPRPALFGVLVHWTLRHWFFSVFMAASKVSVYSRRFDAGLSEVRRLSFDRGVSLRPVLSEERPADMRMNTTTRVELELRPGVLDDPARVPVRSNETRQRQLLVSFGAYVAALASGLDVAVDVVVAGTDTRVHDGFPPRPERREQWLGDVSYVNAGPNERFRSLVTAAAPRLREIRDEQGCYGLAAISVSVPPHGSFLSLKSVGGIATPHHPDQDQSFVGLIDCIPANAQRSAGEMRAPQGALQSWLSEAGEPANRRGSY